MTRAWAWLATATVLGGCDLHGANNDTGGAINLAVSGDYVLAARGTAGLDVVQASTGQVVSHLDPGGGAGTYDDVAADGPVILVHSVDDERLDSFLLTPEGQLAPATRGLEVPAGPYSGVSVAAGRAVVSGGTCAITVLSVDAAAGLSEVGSFEAYRGQPDVTVLPSGAGALLSTHFSGDEDAFVDGQEFGVTAMSVPGLATVAPLGLAGAGFSDGGGTPASWPVRTAIAGDVAYVAHGGGLEVVRVGADLSLLRLAHLDLPLAAVDVAVDGAEAFVVGVPAQVAYVDVSDPAAPRLTGTLPIAGADAMPTAVAVTPDAIFIAANGAGLQRIPR